MILRLTAVYTGMTLDDKIFFGNGDGTFVSSPLNWHRADRLAL